MKTQTSTESTIELLNIKIAIAEDQLKLLNESQKETMLQIQECGLYSHFQQLQSKLENNAVLIMSHSSNLKKWQKELQKENDFLVHLQKKK